MNLPISIFLTLASLGGIVFIVWRKIPLLAQLEETAPENIREAMLERGKALVSSQALRSVATKNLETSLTKARTIAAKTEQHTGKLLEKLQKKSQARKKEFSESYWNQLRRRPKK